MDKSRIRVNTNTPRRMGKGPVSMLLDRDGWQEFKDMLYPYDITLGEAVNALVKAVLDGRFELIVEDRSLKVDRRSTC